MFDQVGGLPVHALVVHAAVVFVPLLALGAVVYALVARWRAKIGWAVIALAVIAPLCTLVSRLSGQKLYERQQGIKGPARELLDAHMGYGTRTFLFTLALGVVTLVMVLLTLRKSGPLPRVASLALAVLVVALAAISSYYVYKTGDSGAHVVWGTF